MSHTPNYISPNRPFNLRIQPEGRKQEFFDMARATGRAPSDVANELIAWYLGYTDDLPTRPIVERHDQRLEATA